MQTNEQVAGEAREMIAKELEARFADEGQSFAQLAIFTRACLPTILNSLRATGQAEAEEGRELDPAVIAAAWGAWRIRHPHERLGPGPGFREAIAAALAVTGTSGQAEAEVARLTAALAEVERERDEARSDEESAWRDKETAICAVSRRCLNLEASASALRERVATLEAATDQLHKDNERLRWRHPAVLPDWNDLPDGLRAKLARTADGYDPDWGGDLAVNMYAALRQAMMEATHADN